MWSSLTFILSFSHNLSLNRIFTSKTGSQLLWPHLRCTFLALLCTLPHLKTLTPSTTSPSDLLGFKERSERTTKPRLSLSCWIPKCRNGIDERPQRLQNYRAQDRSAEYSTEQDFILCYRSLSMSTPDRLNGSRQFQMTRSGATV
jgi:hypothetical protein